MKLGSLIQIPLPASTPPLTASSLRRGARQLAEVDPDLCAVLDRLGVPPMWGREPGFPTLIQIILEQQVSLAAARTLYQRLSSHLGAMTPKAVYAIQVNGLRDFWLTRQKAFYCYGLAARMLDGSLDLTAVAGVRMIGDVRSYWRFQGSGHGAWISITLWRCDVPMSGLKGIWRWPSRSVK